MSPHIFEIELKSSSRPLSSSPSIVLGLVSHLEETSVTSDPAFVLEVEKLV